MRSYTNNKPLGTDGATDAAVRNLQRQTELQFYDSTTIKVEQTLRGVRFHAKIQRQEIGGSAPPTAPVWV